jgi:hypothetical protein
MGWLVIDIVIVYLFKSSVRVIHFFESLKWVRSRASLTDWDIVDPGWGCPSVRLHYTVASSGISTAGSDEVPFYMRWHAKTYSESLSRGLRPIVRVNPNNPRETRFFESDQKSQDAAA